MFLPNVFDPDMSTNEYKSITLCFEIHFLRYDLLKV